MKYDPEKHHRRSIRLKGYDYSGSGLYFVTICTQNRELLFGEIIKGEIVLNGIGEMIEKWWQKIPIKFSETHIDEYVVMPNYIHGILKILNDNKQINSKRGEYMDSPLQKKINNKLIDSKFFRNNVGVEPCFNPKTIEGLPRYISWFKRMTTNEYIKNVNNNNWQPFEKSLWQRNYYEHIIRNEGDLNQIKNYIISNPFSWDEDEENPKNLCEI